MAGTPRSPLTSALLPGRPKAAAPVGLPERRQSGHDTGQSARGCLSGKGAVWKLERRLLVLPRLCLQLGAIVANPIPAQVKGRHSERRRPGQDARVAGVAGLAAASAASLRLGRRRGLWMSKRGASHSLRHSAGWRLRGAPAHSHGVPRGDLTPSPPSQQASLSRRAADCGCPWFGEGPEYRSQRCDDRQLCGDSGRGREDEIEPPFELEGVVAPVSGGLVTTSASMGSHRDRWPVRP